MLDIRLSGIVFVIDGVIVSINAVIESQRYLSLESYLTEGIIWGFVAGSLILSGTILIAYGYLRLLLEELFGNQDD